MVMSSSQTLDSAKSLLMNIQSRTRSVEPSRSVVMSSQLSSTYCHFALVVHGSGDPDQVRTWSSCRLVVFGGLDVRYADGGSPFHS